MRTTMVTIAVLGLVWIGYLVWPVYDLFVLIRGIETPRYLHSYSAYQFRSGAHFARGSVHAYMRRTGIQPSPLARNIAAGAVGIADPIVQKLISSEALSQLTTAGWPVTVVPDGLKTRV
jgi:hypothetical protein